MPRDLYPHLVEADLLVIALLTANTLAKVANGLADSVLTQAVLAFRGPVLAAPAMNVRMWEHPATQENTARLRGRGVELIGPEEGELAEGDRLGRMTEPEEINARCRVLLGQQGPLAGKRVLVSAGGTREPLDAVRYLGNRSSGRMGVALAEEARRRGADVTLLAANLAVAPPAGVAVVETPTAAELAAEAFARPEVDVVLMAAAVADYQPSEARSDKRPKDTEAWTLELEPTEDVLAELGRRRSNGQLLVGFAADHGDAGFGTRPGEAHGKGRRPRRLQRRLAGRHRVRCARQRGRDPGRWRRAHYWQGTEVLDRRRRARRDRTPADVSQAYEDYQEGWRRLRSGRTAQATVPLEKARRAEPRKASIREALGIAYFRLRRWEDAEAEFRAVLEISPVNDYAHYALGRCLDKLGRDTEAQGHYKLARSLKPGERRYEAHIRDA